MSSPRIAILGAGPAGCTLARLLLNSNIQCTVYEGETGLEARVQGGSLDLHTPTGQKALKECGLWDQFLKYARYDGEALAVLDKNMVTYLKAGGATSSSSRGRPEIDRARLRQILVECLPDGIIQWGARVKNVQEKDGNYNIHFTDSTTASGFDLLVGADGAWSKARPILSSATPHFAGLGGFDLVIPDAKKEHPDIHALVNRGSVFSFSDGKGITLQQRGDDSLCCYAWGLRGEDWMNEAGYDVHDPVAVKKYLQETFSDWKGPLGKAPLVASDEIITPRSLYVLPIGHRWEHKHGVTLVGDAAHLMSPFAGEGVNLAMEDAMKLAHTIVDGRESGDWARGIRGFEEDMFRRATPIQKLSQRQMEAMFFTPGAPSTQIAGWVQRALGGAYFDEWWFKVLVPQWFVGMVLWCIFRW